MNHESRRFVGCAHPLARVAAGLVDGASSEGGAIDLARDVVVVPGARARRALLLELATAAQAIERRLVPPRIVGLAQLEDVLAQPRPRAVATTTAVVLAIHAALAERADRPVAIATALEIERLSRELAGADRDLSAAAQAAMALGGDGDRYLRMAETLTDARERLAAVGLCDPHADSPRARAFGGTLHLVGVVDPTTRQRALIAAHVEHAVVWCVGDLDDASRFDAMGGLNLTCWVEVDREVDLVNVRRVDGPMEQAAAAADWLVELAEKRSGAVQTDEVVFALADADLAPVVVRELRARGIGVHDARGMALAALPPARLLARARDFLREPDTHTLRRLAMLADLEPILGPRAMCGFDDWRRFHHERETPVGWIDADESTDSPAELDRRVRELLGGLPSSAPLSSHAPKISELLAQVFGDRSDGDSRGLVDNALAEIKVVLENCAEAPSALCQSIGPAEALDWVLAFVRGRQVREVPRDEELDLVGWLELALDSAPDVVVIGMNEGRVPETAADTLLPDPLRRALAMPDARSRLARDRYVLDTLLRRGTPRFTFARFDARGEPLAPSSLLLSGTGEPLARRVRALTESAAEAAVPGIRPSRFARPMPPQPPVDLREIAVTGFKDYIACPYRFWLRHIVKLKSVEPAGDTLDDRSFGLVAHAVVEAFGRDDLKGRSATEEAIRARLECHLDVVLHERGGAKLGGGLRIQRQFLRERLGWFARAQAELAREGWEICAVEHAFQWSLEMPDGVAVTVKGKIDRIDRRRVDGGWELRVIDYKTTSNAHDPDGAHRSKQGDWRDLQLPLYHRFVDSLTESMEEDWIDTAHGRVLGIECGYFAIGATADKVGWRRAEVLEKLVSDAVTEARAIVGKIRAGEFEINPDYKAYEDDPLEILCRTAMQSQVGRDESDDDEAGES